MTAMQEFAGVRTMYVPPYMASDSNMRKYMYSNNKKIYIYNIIHWHMYRTMYDNI